MPQRPVINPPPVSEMFFGPDGTEKSVFDSFPKRIAKSVTELLGLDAPPDPSDFANPLGAVIGKPAQKLSQQVIKTLSGETVPRGMRAYHGSPHQPFNRFDMNQIGTGEGAQAFGHGLYFAEDEGTARFYRGGNTAFQVGDETVSSPLPKPVLDMVRRGGLSPSALAMTSHFPQVAGGVPGQREFQNTAAGALDIAIARGDKNPAASAIDRLRYERSYSPDHVDEYDRAIELISEWDRLGSQRMPAGSLSEVNLRVRPEELLDLDRKMGQQTQGVQDAVNRALSSVEARRASYAKAAGSTHVPMRTIPDTTRAFNLASPGYSTNPLGSNPRDVSRRLREAGIPVSTYLDQKSRAGARGTRNIVMFDDDKIDIVKQLMLLLGLGAPAASAAQGLAEPQRPVLEPSI